jgi:hypothetical protein
MSAVREGFGQGFEKGFGSCGILSYLDPLHLPTDPEIAEVHDAVVGGADVSESGRPPAESRNRFVRKTA